MPIGPQPACYWFRYTESWRTMERMRSSVANSHGVAQHDTAAQLWLILMAALWAANFSITKEALASITPLAFNALRFPLACAVVLLALRRRGPIPLPESRHAARVVAYGLLGNVLYQGLFIFGLAYSRAGTASILLAGTPIMTALLSSLAGHERVASRVWLGVLATAAGVAVVVLSGGGLGSDIQAHATPLGSILMICAAAAWASYTVGTRPLVQYYGSLPVTAWTLVVGTIAIVAIGAPDLARTDVGAISVRVWFAVVYAGALSIGTAYLIWHHGVRRLGNTRTATFANLVPVLALLFAWLWLSEVPAPGQVVGAGVIIAGVTLAQRRPLARPPIGS